MTKEDFENIKIYRFSIVTLAFAFADGAHKPMTVLLGDDEMFWAVRLADGSRLMRAGYQAAPRF